MAERGAVVFRPAKIIAAIACGLIIAGSGSGSVSVLAQNVPLPTPAPLPKSGSPPAPAANSIPADTQKAPGFFPFTSLFGKSSSSNQATAFDDKQRALLDRISLYLSSVQTLVGDFVQIGPDGNRTQGTFSIQKPGRVRFQYNPPSPTDIIADGSMVAVRDRRLATQDTYLLSQTPLRYLLADRIDLLHDTDVVSVTSDDTFATVVIEEKQVAVGTTRLMIMFDAKDLTLKQWTVTDPQGFDTTVAVYDLDTIKKPDPNLFVINYQSNSRGGVQ